MRLAVSPPALAEQLGARRFVALPREEIDRHYACVEIVAAGTGFAEVEVEVVAAFHHNHAWVTHPAPASSSADPSNGARTSRRCSSTR